MMKHLEFSSSSLPSIDITSTWHKPKPKQEIATQTRAQKYVESDTQTSASIHQAVQTDLDSNDLKRSAALKLDAKQQAALVAFLDTAERDVSRQLLQNLSSRAYDGFDVKWEDDVDTNSKLYQLQDPYVEEKLIVTCLAWSASGRTVAAAFGRRDHAAWCTHSGRVSTWSLSGKVVTDKPTFSAQVSTCLMSLIYHPVQNTVIAGGSYHGQIMIWDTNKNENPVIATTGDGELAHHEAVSSISWVPSSSGQHVYDILTTSTEGKILIYSFSNDLSLPIIGSRITLSNVARVVRPPLNSKVAKNVFPVGITAGSLPQAVGSYVDHLIVGTETGFVLKCNTSGTRIGDPSEKSEDLMNPVIFGFASHTGPIHSIACAPFHRNLFLTCGDDCEVRVYNALQPNPILVLEPSSMSLTCAAWSPTRPALYAVGCADGNVYFYDLRTSTTSPAYTLSMNTSSTSSSFVKRGITSLAFSKRPNKPGHHLTDDFFATADDAGLVHIYRLSTDFSREVIGEMWTLDNISN
ncbi:hypothetical protein SeMB42_g05467 [Synchytrium endobioticum]|uniref:Uncharacterized protein n=1 Tax=Synchytrium endobioticum TaxID=286115 RepID=A0A507CRL8_9FUNG|nr:hypothetical protein SeMB42_g05467 [Synchytrium endobioticum]TPX46292.1 hypothetical protein SeLEV6574_g03309 [Synchytrium endobioticum]